MFFKNVSLELLRAFNDNSAKSGIFRIFYLRKLYALLLVDISTKSRNEIILGGHLNWKYGPSYASLPKHAWTRYCISQLRGDRFVLGECSEQRPVRVCYLLSKTNQQTFSQG